MATKKTDTATNAAPKAPKKVSAAAAKAAAKAGIQAQPEVVAATVDAAKAATELPATAMTAMPSREAIAKRSFALFVARKGVGGDAFEDWIRAERELTTVAAHAG